MEQLANNAVTTLNGAINNSTTSVVITSSTNWPSTGYYHIICESEIMLVTARSGTTLTVVRGQEGTSGASHADLSAIAIVLTKETIEHYLRDYGHTSVALGDRLPNTAGTYDEEFNGVADTLPSGWAFNTTPSGSDEWTLNSRWPSILMVEGNGTVSYAVNRTGLTPGAGDIGFWWKVFGGPVTGSDTPNIRGYLFDTAEANGLGIELYANSDHYNLRSLQMSASAESVWTSAKDLSFNDTIGYFGLTRTSANVWTAWVSNNGMTWNRFGTQTKSFTINKFKFSFATTPDQTRAGIDWFRFRNDILLPRP